MSVIFAAMKVKQWTGEEVGDLIRLAKSKRISQESLADMVGVTASALYQWRNSTGNRQPKGAYRRALTFAEMCIQLEIKPDIPPDIDTE